jgi:hypothetical protein
MLFGRSGAWQNDVECEGGAKRVKWRRRPSHPDSQYSVTRPAKLQRCVLQVGRGQGCAARRTPPGPISPG